MDQVKLGTGTNMGGRTIMLMEFLEVVLRNKKTGENVSVSLETVRTPIIPSSRSVVSRKCVTRLRRKA